MNALKYIRDTYLVEAHRGHRILYGEKNPLGGTILGGKDGRLRVRLDGGSRTVLLHPTWEVTYLPVLANAEISNAPTSAERKAT